MKKTVFFWKLCPSQLLYFAAGLSYEDYLSAWHRYRARPDIPGAFDRWLLVSFMTFIGLSSCPIYECSPYSAPLKPYLEECRRLSRD